MDVKELLKITRGSLLLGRADLKIEPSRISTDSRSIKRGEFFVALKGPRLDGQHHRDSRRR